ncbi:MAG: DUF58 domain-containing protein [Chloroflexi bacterium]|nr:DUF58 domain-containing protein [Chloroflexota bacterium]
MKPDLRLNNRLLPILTGLLIVLQLIMPYKGWVILLVVLGGAWFICWLWALLLARGLTLTREMRFGWAQVGDRLEERFTLINDSAAPAPWVEITDHSTLPGSRASRVTGVGGRDSLRWYVEAVCNRRGVYTLGPTTLRTGDPFGIYTVALQNPATSTLMIMPPIVPLPAIEVSPGGRAGEGRPRANTLERTVSASGVRDYSPGDSLHSIHWPTSARRESLFVRLFDSTPAGDWWIFLDMDWRAQAGHGLDSTDEHGVILAASLADRGLAAGKAVGLVAHSDQLLWLPPQAGEGQRWEILRALALVARGPQPLSELLARARPSFRQLASVIIITPAIDGSWIESILPLLQRGVAPTVLLMDTISFGKRTSREQLEATTTTLAELGVAHYLITRDLLDQPELRPGTQGQWDWQVSPHGKAMPRTRRDLTWKVLS